FRLRPSSHFHRSRIPVTRQPGRPTHISALLPGALLPAILLLAAAPAAAQAPPAPPSWSLTPSMALVHFTDVGVDGESGSVRFSRSISVGLTAGRALGPVTLLLGLEYLSAGFQVRDEFVNIETAAAGLSRTRLSLLARRTIGHLGHARLSLGAGPTLDIWSPDGADSRTAAGAEAQLSLALDAG